MIDDIRARLAAYQGKINNFYSVSEGVEHLREDNYKPEFAILAANAPLDIAYLLTLNDTAQQRIEELTAENQRLSVRDKTAKYHVYRQKSKELEADNTKLTAEVASVNAKYDTVRRDISQLEAESKCRHPFEPKPCFMCLNINNSCSTGGSACKGFEWRGTEGQE